MWLTAINWVIGTKAGRGVAIALIVIAAFFAWRAYERADAVEQDRAERAAEQAERNAETRRRINDAVNSGGDADDARERLRDALSGR